jgi:hypothetical protein
MSDHAVLHLLIFISDGLYLSDTQIFLADSCLRHMNINMSMHTQIRKRLGKQNLFYIFDKFTQIEREKKLTISIFINKSFFQ